MALTIGNTTEQTPDFLKILEEDLEKGSTGFLTLVFEKIAEAIQVPTDTHPYIMELWVKEFCSKPITYEGTTYSLTFPHRSNSDPLFVLSVRPDTGEQFQYKYFHGGKAEQDPYGARVEVQPYTIISNGATDKFSPQEVDPNGFVEAFQNYIDAIKATNSQ